MSKRKDWRNFERRREDALRDGVGSAAVSSIVEQQSYYDNYGYDRKGDSNYYEQKTQYTNHHHVTPSHHGTHSEFEPRLPSYDDDENESQIQKKRKCRDVICLAFFLAAILLMVGVTGYAAVQGNLERFTNGVDLNCDICGIENNMLPGIKNSGKDLRHLNFLYIKTDKSTNNSKKILFPDVEIGSRNHIPRPSSRECLTKCPSGYKLMLNRCIQNEQSINTAFVSDNKSALRIDDVTNTTVDSVYNFFQDIGAEIENSWQDILWICLISLGMALLVTILLRLFAGVIIWVLVVAVSLAFIGSSIGLWVFWLTKREDKGSWTDTQVTALVVVAAVVSFLTVIILLILLFMRKRIALVIRLFNEAGKSIHSMPLLLFQPLVTFLALVISLSSWLTIAILIESSGSPVEGNQNNGLAECSYKKDWFTLFSRWWNLFMITWMTQFVLGCQHMIIAGAVSIWFFKRDKRRVGFPIAVSYKRLVRYHLGSIAFGSLIIAIVKMIRYVLNSIQKRLGGANPICRGIFCCCKCCVWCLEKFLNFLNRNAYIEIAIHGYGFCKSARKAFSVIMNNALRLTAINSIGDFVLFLAKITIVALSVFIGHELIKNKEDIHNIWVPLAIGGIFAYFVAHCFISVYEMAIDTIFICFCEDCEMNDGIQKPYYMSKGLMEFVKKSEKVFKARKEQRKNKRSSK